MIKTELCEMLDKIIDKYEKSQTSVIHERSGHIDNDVILLKKEVLELKMEALSLIEQMEY